MNNEKPERSKDQMYEWGVRRVLVLHARIEAALKLLNEMKDRANRNRWRYLFSFSKKDRTENEALIVFCEQMLQELGSKDRDQENVSALVEIMRKHGLVD